MRLKNGKAVLVTMRSLSKQRSRDRMTLTPKAEMFCLEYLKDLNGTRAAIRAGYSPRSAKVQASRMLTKVNVSDRIKELCDQRYKALAVEAKDILKELLLIAKSDIGEVWDEEGRLIDIKKIPDATRRAIKGVEVTEEFSGHGKDRELIGFTKKVKFWDKVKALELLGKHLRLFADDLPMDRSVEITIYTAPPRQIDITPTTSRKALTIDVGDE